MYVYIYTCWAIFTLVAISLSHIIVALYSLHLKWLKKPHSEGEQNCHT